MPKLVEYTFSFQDLLSAEQATNQRWVELMEVIDQLFTEFVYPELERTKALKSVYTAYDEDLDALNIDKFYYLFENILATAKTKRVALWMQYEIIKAKNRDDSVLLAVSSLGLPREAIELVKLYSKKAGEYNSSSLTKPEQINPPEDYFLTSRKGFYLDQSMLENLGFDAVEAQEAVRTVLRENVVPEHIDLQILLKIYSKLAVIKVIPSVKPFEAVGFPIGNNSQINYQIFSARSDVKVVSRISQHSQFII